MPRSEVPSDIGHGRPLFRMQPGREVDESIERVGMRMRPKLGDRKAARVRGLVAFRRPALFGGENPRVLPSE
ncbi:MAG: hypothetical protein LC797_07775 [Chloroflexi bacterium]|nr:hypothetical protein [Chloroflexota bacterium]